MRAAQACGRLSNAHICTGSPTNRTYTFGTAQGVIRPSSVTAPCPLCGNTAASTQYDTNGNVIQRTEHDGSTTKLTYDAKNRELTRVEKFGTANAITYTTQWHETWNLPVLKIEPNKITAYVYGGRGNLRGQAETPTTDSSGGLGTAALRDKTKPILSSGWTYDANSLPVGTVSKSREFGKAVVVMNQSHLTYDAMGDEIFVKNLLNQKTRTSYYNLDGLPISGHLSSGVTFAYKYSANGFVIEEKWGGEITRIDWRKDSKIDKFYVPTGGYTQYTYDASGRFVSTVDYFFGPANPLNLLRPFVNMLLSDALAGPQDQWYGHNEPAFRDYVHNIKQEWGTGGAYNFNKQELDNLKKDWKDEGCPRGKGGKSGKGTSIRGGGRANFFRGGGRGLE